MTGILPLLLSLLACTSKDADTGVPPDTACAPVIWTLGLDGDGWAGESVVEQCEEPADYAVATGDCDDDDAAVHPDAEELCDGVDNDCDGELDVLSAYRESDEYADRAGRAWLWYGPLSGTRTTDDADVQIQGSGEEMFLGYDLSATGDLNGDGCDDIAASEVLWSSPDTTTPAGLACGWGRVYRDAFTPPPANASRSSRSSPVAVLLSGSPLSAMKTATAAAARTASGAGRRSRGARRRSGG